MHSIFSWPFGTNTGRGGDQGKNLQSSSPAMIPRLNKGPSFVPVVIPIDLSIARVNAAAAGAEIGVPGNFLMAYRANPNDRSGVINIQFDDSGATPTEMRLGDFMVHPFDRLIVTNPAQAIGNRIDLWIGQIDNNGFYPWLGKAEASGGIQSQQAQQSISAVVGLGTDNQITIGVPGQSIRVSLVGFFLTTGAGAPATPRIACMQMVSGAGIAGVQAQSYIFKFPGTQIASNLGYYEAAIGLPIADLGPFDPTGFGVIPNTMQSGPLPDTWLPAPIIVNTDITNLQAGDQVGVIQVVWSVY